LIFGANQEYKAYGFASLRGFAYIFSDSIANAVKPMLSRLMAVLAVSMPRVFKTITARPIARAMPLKAMEKIFLFMAFSFFDPNNLLVVSGCSQSRKKYSQNAGRINKAADHEKLRGSKTPPTLGEFIAWSSGAECLIA
jgi:hypothetical protein